MSLIQDEINRIEKERTERTHIHTKFSQMEAESFINVDIKLPHPPLVLSIGQHDFKGNMYPTGFATKGNFSCISGASKSKKTFFKSMLCAAYIGGNSGRFNPNIKGHREADHFLIDIDTEQSEYHAQLVFDRTKNLVGGNWPFYKPYSLRRYSHVERLQFIEYIIYESQYKDNIGLLSIDGIADLVADVNSLAESNAMIQKLMTWTDQKKFHIINVLHNNPGNDKATGHLGTFVDKKAETRAVVKSDEDGIKVTFPFTRGFHIEGFEFKIQQDGLPTTNLQDYNPDLHIEPSATFETEKQDKNIPF